MQNIKNIIKNTYRTLLTRGMKGCYVFFTDKETQEYFLSKVLSFLQPVILKPENPAEVFLENNALYFIVDIEAAEQRRARGDQGSGPVERAGGTAARARSALQGRGGCSRSQ